MEAVIVREPTSKKVLKNVEKILKIVYVVIIALMLYAPIVFMIILSFNKALSGNEFTELLTSQNKTMTWIFRLVGTILMIAGVASILSIIKYYNNDSN